MRCPSKDRQLSFIQQILAGRQLSDVAKVSSPDQLSLLEVPQVNLPIPNLQEDEHKTVADWIAYCPVVAQEQLLESFTGVLKSWLTDRQVSLTSDFHVLSDSCYLGRSLGHKVSNIAVFLDTYILCILHVEGCL